MRQQPGRQFERWRQENFFKYLREEYALDALAEHAVEAADPAREVPNPARKALDAKLREARAALQQLRAEYKVKPTVLIPHSVRGRSVPDTDLSAGGRSDSRRRGTADFFSWPAAEALPSLVPSTRSAPLCAEYGRKAAENAEAQRRTMRGFKIAHGKLGQALREAARKIAPLEKRRAALPERVAVAAAVSGAVVKLSPERQLLTNILKMVAFQVESDLVRLVTPHYRRAEDEGRTLIHAALQADGDLEVGDDQLTIALAPLSAPHRTRALAAVCAQLNATAARFPGSRLRLVYAVRGPL